MADDTNDILLNNTSDDNNLSDFEKSQDIVDSLESIYSASDDETIAKLAKQAFPQITDVENTLLSTQEGAVINTLNSVNDIKTATEQAKFSFDNNSANSTLAQVNFTNALNNSVNDVVSQGLQERETLRNNTSVYTSLAGDILQNEQTATVAGEYLNNTDLSVNKRRDIATDITDTLMQADASGELDFLYDEQDISNGYLISEGWYNELYKEGTQNLWNRLAPALFIGIDVAIATLFAPVTGGLSIALLAAAGFAIGTGVAYASLSTYKWVRDANFRNNLQANFETSFPSEQEWEQATQTVYNESNTNNDYEIIDGTAYPIDNTLSFNPIDTVIDDTAIDSLTEANLQSTNQIVKSFDETLTDNFGNVLDLSSEIALQKETTKSHLKKALVTSLGNVLGQKTLSSIDSGVVENAMKNVETNVDWMILKKQSEQSGYNKTYSKIAIKDNDSQSNINRTYASFVDDYPTNINNTKEARFARISQENVRQTYNNAINSVANKGINNNSSIF